MENLTQKQDEALAILIKNGIDVDYFEEMGGKEIELGSEEWMDVLSDIVGKDVYNEELSEEDSILIGGFIGILEEMGIELV